MANRRNSPSPLVGQTWHHASAPKPVESEAPAATYGFSPLTYSPGSIVPAGDCSWSGGWKQFTTNSNSSDWPGQSAASSASWSDELENESAKRLSEQYEQLESALYGDESGDLLSNPNLALECKQWKERFPHLRAVGVSIKIAPATTDCQTYESDEIDLIENEEEEIIASHGCYESEDEMKAIVPSNEVQTSPTPLAFDRYQEKVKEEVLSQLFSCMWSHVVKKIDPVFEKILERSKLLVQTPAKSLVEANSCNMLQPISNCDVGFSNTEHYLRISPLSTVQLASPKKSVVGTPSPVSQISKSSSRDLSVPQIAPLNARNASPAALKSTPTITLAPPPVVVFPSPEKILNTLSPDSRNMLQSARSFKKLSPKITQSAKSRLLQVKEPSQEEGRFVTQDKPRTSAQSSANMRKSARGYWNRHGMLPPISLKENIKTGSAASQRSTSALMKFGKPDLDTRPNTSLPSKSTLTLLPLHEGNKKKNRMELAQEWLDKQLSTSNNSKHHLSVYVDTSSRWRSHNFGYRK